MADFGKDFQHILSLLQIEKLRCKKWGERFGIGKETKDQHCFDGTMEEYDVVESILFRLGVVWTPINYPRNTVLRDVILPCRIKPHSDASLLGRHGIKRKCQNGSRSTTKNKLTKIARMSFLFFVYFMKVSVLGHRY